MSSSAATPEARVRAALAEGRAPDGGDLHVVLAELDRARTESEQRWQAIGRLAPAAKGHRARAEAQARTLEQLRRHLDRLDELLGERASHAPRDSEPSLRAWAAQARALLEPRSG